MATIIRQSYIDKIERYLGKETIIVLVGQRRVGKSCMMKMIRDRKKADDCNNIIFIDKEKREFDNIQTYQNLIRLGYQVYVGQLQAGEINFVCTKPGGERIYVQASYIIADDATREREFGNLRAIKDNYPKYVISMTPLLTKNDDDGITHLHLRKFLTEGI